MEKTVVEPAGPAEQPVVARLWQLYSHDLSQFRDRPPEPDGTYPEHDLAAYFSGDEARRPYVTRYGPVPAGFALVHELSGVRQVRGFFVVRPLRHRRVGQAAAAELLAAHPGGGRSASRRRTAAPRGSGASWPAGPAAASARSAGRCPASRGWPTTSC